MTDAKSDAFISYSSSDCSLAQAIYDCLCDAGFQVWFDRVRLQPGFDWHREIEAACEASRVVIPILTPRWKESWWTRYETYAHDAIIPVVFEGALHEIATAPLRRYQAHHVDVARLAIHDWAPLLEAVRATIARTARAPKNRLTLLAALRYQHNKYFVGRDTKLNELLERLFGDATTAISQARVQAITAFGGVGKTTLANEFAQRFWRLYRQIFWVDCRLGLEAEFSRIGSTLNEDGHSIRGDQKECAALALARLNIPHERDQRLLVLAWISTGL